MHEKHSTDANYPCQTGRLYIFTSKQKGESGGYHAAVLFWCKFLIRQETVVKRLKAKKVVQRQRLSLTRARVYNSIYEG